MSKMKKLEYQLRFVTPAFLGDAEQSARWRTPPFKAQLRQWWRVAYAAQQSFKVDVAAMRHQEGLLFGHAWLEDDQNEQGNKVAARKSLVRIKLDGGGDSWSLGTQKGVQPLPNNLDTSYAWFGLIKRGKGLPDRTGIKANQAESVRKLSLAVPDTEAKRLQEVISLIHSFGLLGSRSRGGWGALHVDDENTLAVGKMQRYARNIDDCLKEDWAMSLAKDTKGLCIWESSSTFDSWDKAMKFIAAERKKVRTALKQQKDLRPALGFASPGRMPSPLRWKVVAPEQGRLRVRVFAMPHSIPADGGKSLSQQNLHSAWHSVSRSLDSIQSLPRLEDKE
ncbi:MAG: hypothetical protein ACK5ME_00365 [Parahaliea sp.]